MLATCLQKDNEQEKSHITCDREADKQQVSHILKTQTVHKTYTADIFHKAVPMSTSFITI